MTPDPTRPNLEARIRRFCLADDTNTMMTPTEMEDVITEVTKVAVDHAEKATKLTEPDPHLGDDPVTRAARHADAIRRAAYEEGAAAAIGAIKRITKESY